MYSRGCEGFSFRWQWIVVAALIVIALAGTVSAAGGDGPIGFAKQCYGSLNITSTPSGAAVSIDGTNTGSTPFVRSRVPMGPHSIRVSSPMYVDATDTITVSCDQTYSKQYTLAPIITTTPVPGYQPPMAVQLQDPVKVQPADPQVVQNDNQVQPVGPQLVPPQVVPPVVAVKKENIPKGDLSIVSTDPVQVLYNQPLVKNKGTAFRVRVNSTFREPVSVKFRLVLPAEMWGVVRGNARNPEVIPATFTFPQEWGPVEIPAKSEDFVVMLPYIPDTERLEKVEITGKTGALNSNLNEASSPGRIAGRLIVDTENNYPNGNDAIPDVRVVPKPIADSVSYTVIIDSRNEINETEEDNNEKKSSTYPVVRTQSHSFGIQRVIWIDNNKALTGDGGGFPPGYACGVTSDPGGLDTSHPGMKVNLEYFLGVMPVADDEVYGTFLPGMDTMHDPANYYPEISQEIAQTGNLDWGIVEVCGWVGQNGGNKVVMIGNLSEYYANGITSEFYQNLAHETTHYYEERNWIEEKKLPEKASDVYGCNANIETETRDCQDVKSDEGFWVNRWLDYPRKPMADWEASKIAAWEKGEWDWLRLCYYMDFTNYAPWCWQRDKGLGKVDIDTKKKTGDDYRNGYRDLLEKMSIQSDSKGLFLKVIGQQDGTVTLETGGILNDAKLDRLPGSAGNYFIVIRDARGKEVSRTGIGKVFPESSPPETGSFKSEESVFAGVVEWNEETTEVQIQDDSGKVLDSKTVSAHAPVIRIVSPNGGETWNEGSPATVSWEASDADRDPMTFWIGVSTDGGKTWLPMKAGLTGTTAVMDTSGLFGSRNALVKIKVSDGVNTNEDVSDGSFTILSKYTHEEKTDERSPTKAGIWIVTPLSALGVSACWYLIRKGRR